MPTVAVLAAHRHPRLRYVLRELGRDLGYTFRLFTEEGKWVGFGGEAKVVYGGALSPGPSPKERGESSGELQNKDGIEGVLNLPAHGFLSGRPPVEADFEVTNVTGLPVFFQTEDGPDLLACMFYCLSRYEEYEPFAPDKHERFPASASHAQRNGYLLLPVVRMYARHLADRLRRVFPELPPPRVHPYRLLPTYDIDLLWAYRYRGWKGAASGLRDVATGKSARARARFLSGKDNDPFFNLDELLRLHPDVRPHIFWLLADNVRREDVNPYPIPAEQTEAMQSLADRATHGIHPGYVSAETEGKLRRETGRFQKIFGERPLHSRQHFLRLRFPDTYRALRQNGITHDHSMGYGDAVGWRAGTNLPFRWYDLQQETMTGLTVHPFAVMDVTLKNYLKLSPAAATVTIDDLKQGMMPYGGNFTLLWHNSSFAAAHGWAGWREVYEGLWR